MECHCGATSLLFGGAWSSSWGHIAWSACQHHNPVLPTSPKQIAKRGAPDHQNRNTVDTDWWRMHNNHAKRIVGQRHVLKCTKCLAFVNIQKWEFEYHVCGEGHCSDCDKFDQNTCHCFVKVSKPKPTSGAFYCFDCESTTETIVTCTVQSRIQHVWLQWYTLLSTFMM